jgi:hypothetical protein
VTFRGEKAEQGLLSVLQRGHPVAGALLGVGRQIGRQAPDALEGGARGRVQTAEVVIHRWHTPHDTQCRRR